MGTFHHGKSELHGITVVVETDHGELYVGRCEDMDAERIILLDADVHRGGEQEPSREEYLQRAETFGVWKKFDRLVLARADVRGVRRLGDTARRAGGE